MKEELRDLIADIDSSVHESKLDTLGSIFINEMKEDMLDEHNCSVFLESRVLTIKPIPKGKSYKDYDFISHDTTQGSNNRQFAQTLYSWYRLSRIKHGSDGLRSEGDEYIPRGVANEMKYQLALTLLKDCTKFKPNFAKVIYVSENIGKCKKHGEEYNSALIFVEINLPDGEYMFSLHLPRPTGTSSAKTSKHVKQSKKKRLDAVIDLERYNSPDVARYGNNDVSKYIELENKYNDAMRNNRTSDTALNALIKAFDM